MFKIHGIDDSVTSCDCCGRKNLKHTIIVEVVATGEKMNYGAVCAQKHTKYSAKEIKQKVSHAEFLKEEEYKRKVKEARIELWETEEYIQYTLKMNRAHQMGLIGKPFADFCRNERMIFSAKEKEIISKFNLDIGIL